MTTWLVIVVALLALAIGVRVGLAVRGWRRQRTLVGLREMAPAAFERAVGGWLGRDGWVVDLCGGKGDEGVDLLAFHGDEVLAVQCKRYAESAAVTPAMVRELYGAAVALGATQAVLVTTGRVSLNAIEWASRLAPPGPPLALVLSDRLEAWAAGRKRIRPGSLSSATRASV